MSAHQAGHGTETKGFQERGPSDQTHKNGIARTQVTHRAIW